MEVLWEDQNAPPTHSIKRFMSSHFHQTHWTLVLRSRGEGEAARAALSELCEVYYEPVVAFLRREGRTEDGAREAAHEFFQGLLRGGLGKPDPGRGRFRNYLLRALKNSLGKKRAAENTAKRGGRVPHVSLTSAGEAGDLPGDAASGDHAFDRDWALALIARALRNLQEENRSKPGRFEVLRPWLDGGTPPAQASAARELGITETAVKVAIHRLRTRFRELVRHEVAGTVGEGSDVSGELSYLIAVVSQQPE